MLPVPEGSCAWSFAISSPITVHTKGARVCVPRPKLFVINKSITFNVVSRHMALAYAALFSKALKSFNPQSSPVRQTRANDLSVYSYVCADVTPEGATELFPWPKISFHAEDASGSQRLIEFSGPQSMQIKVTVVNATDTCYLSFAYDDSWFARCQSVWTLGSVALIPNPSSLGPDSLELTYPRFVSWQEVTGGESGLWKNYVVLAPPLN